MTTQEKIAVMQAFVDGKQVEFRVKGQNSDLFDLVTVINPLWDWGLYEYRIKPEQKPKSREDITKEWVDANNVKAGAKVKISDGKVIATVVRIEKRFIVLDYGSGETGYIVELIEEVIKEKEPTREAIKKYVPFTFEDRELFKWKWVIIFDDYKKEYLICKILSAGVTIHLNGSDRFLTYEEAMVVLKFIDGSPFGKEVWE